MSFDYAKSIVYLFIIEMITILVYLVVVSPYRILLVHIHTLSELLKLWSH